MLLNNINITGYFILSQASSRRKPGDKANLVSPKLRSGHWCLTFSYNMFGSDAGELNVCLGMGSYMRQKIFTISVSQGNKWKKAKIDINVQNNCSVSMNNINKTRASKLQFQFK